MQMAAQGKAMSVLPDSTPSPAGRLRLVLSWFLFAAGIAAYFYVAQRGIARIRTIG